jgi:hypothetical protein
MDLFLDLAHAAAALVWLAGAAVLALILVVAGRDPGASRRAAAEAEVIGRRVLAPASALTLVTGLLLVGPAGLGAEAWVVLGSVLVLARSSRGPSSSPRPLPGRPSRGPGTPRAAPSAWRVSTSRRRRRWRGS